MCGIVGYVGQRDAAERACVARMAERMCRSLEHRGPDDSDVWSAPGGDVALGHRRLSIVDLHTLGSQPDGVGWGAAPDHVQRRGLQLPGTPVRS